MVVDKGAHFSEENMGCKRFEASRAISKSKTVNLSGGGGGGGGLLWFVPGDEVEGREPRANQKWQNPKTVKFMRKRRRQTPWEVCPQTKTNCSIT